MAESPVLDLLREKGFLGRDFLTWLWVTSELRGGVVAVPGEGDVEVAFERFLVLESGEGEASRSLTCRGLQAELDEAKAGLASGKKVARAHLRLGRGQDAWRLTLRGDSLDVSSLRVRKGVPGAEEADDEIAFEGRVLERAALLEQAVATLDLLFRAFLDVRLDPEAWAGFRSGIRRWLERG
ncbi:hypothetical protein [Dissulfurirhabdus thermomarina]|uniref:hypothetical protein n=1 Tax=Dissulfurirhabdus thermomarina TaxID=1765737 RepID=UPI0015E8CCB6|nr:hypothetical protein [Dissulfurirhabdus thermomarina]